MPPRPADPRVEPPRPEPADAISWPEATSVVVGLRLLALAIVTCAALFLPAHVVAPGAWIPAIVAAAVLGTWAPLLARVAPSLIADLAIVAQTLPWSYLASISGGLRSPLISGLLLETALAGAWRGRRGATVAALAGALLSAAIAFRGAMDGWGLVIALGFLGLAWGATTWTVELLARQRRGILEAHAALRRRARGLAEEMRRLGEYMDPLLAIDESGRVVSVNRAGLDLLAARAGEVLGAPWQAVLGSDRDATATIAAALADGVTTRAAPMAVTGPGGRSCRTLADVWTSEAAEGRRTFVMLRSPAAATGEDPVRRLGMVVACVSHQFRNALGSVRGFAEDIGRSSTLTPGQAESAEHVVRAVRSLNELCESVLALAGSQPALHVDLPLAETVASAVALSGGPAGRVRMVGCPTDVHAHAARGPLVQALFNLLDNACHATPPGGEVRVRVSGDGDRAVVEIADDGPGLPAGWENGNGPAPTHDGNGLGLLAARRFVEACGGRLEFERPLEGGTRARVVLTAAPGHDR